MKLWQKTPIIAQKTTHYIIKKKIKVAISKRLAIAIVENPMITYR